MEPPSASAVAAQLTPEPPLQAVAEPPPAELPAVEEPPPAAALPAAEAHAPAEPVVARRPRGLRHRSGAHSGGSAGMAAAVAAGIAPAPVSAGAPPAARPGVLRPPSWGPSPVQNGAGAGDEEHTVDWTIEEQNLLESGLARFTPDCHTSLTRYIKIAAMLPKKGVRDVALRVRWMTRKDSSSKKRKATSEDGTAAKKGRPPRGERMVRQTTGVGGARAAPGETAAAAGGAAAGAAVAMNGALSFQDQGARTGGQGKSQAKSAAKAQQRNQQRNQQRAQQRAQQKQQKQQAAAQLQLQQQMQQQQAQQQQVQGLELLRPEDRAHVLDAGFPARFGRGGEEDGSGSAGKIAQHPEELLSQNVDLINQIRRNAGNPQSASHNTELLATLRDNIIRILNSMNHAPGIMRQMPPLPVQLNLELASLLLPPSSAA